MEKTTRERGNAMNDENFEVDGQKVHIIDYDVTLEDYSKSENYNGSRVEVTRYYHWTGTLKIGIGEYDVYELKFKLDDDYEIDNGGNSAQITSEKPKDIPSKDWDYLKDFLAEYLEEEYDLNEWIKGVYF